MSITAMKQALEALESYHGYMEPLTTVFGGPRVPAEQSTTGKVEKAITALRTAITKAESRASEQETQSVNATGGPKAHFSLAEQPAAQPLYTTPPATGEME